MDAVEELRSRLATLTVDGVRSPHASAEASLVVCRARRDQLRALKREVLTRLWDLRSATREDARKSFGPKPSARELWQRREEGARELLKDVRRRVIGLVDEDAVAHVEALGELNGEIDRRLEQLEHLEGELASAAEIPEVPRSADRRRNDRDENGDDALYAAVGAATQAGRKPGPVCAHCGQGIEADDRFCRRCGHRL